MHQCLIQWQGDNVKVVQADASVSVAIADSLIWEFEDVECFSGRDWEEDQSLKPIHAVSSESLF